MVKRENIFNAEDVLMHLRKSDDDRLMMVDKGPFTITGVLRGAPGDPNALRDDPFEPPLTGQTGKPTGSGVFALSSGKLRADAREEVYVITWTGSSGIGPHIEIDA